MPQRIEFIRPARKTYKVRKQDARPNAYQRGYCDRRHYAWRRAVLLRDNWTCRACGHVCGEKGGAHADHVSPVVPGTKQCVDGRSRYDVENGQCLCPACHMRKTNDDTAKRNDRPGRGLPNWRRSE